MADVPAQSEPLDAVILGTSPVALIEAVLRARRGQRVVVVEANESLGGCWRTTGFEEIQNIEGACHLLENYRGAYEFLEQVVGLDTHQCVPPPEVLDASGRRTAYNARARTLRRIVSVGFRMALVAVVRGLERLTGGRLRVPRMAGFRLAEGWSSLAAYCRHPLLGSSTRRAVRYVDGGGPRMLSFFKDELMRREVPILQATALHLDATDGVQLRLDDGQTLRARELVATESARLDSLVCGAAVQEFERRLVEYPHLILEVSGLSEAILSYVQLTGDPLVARISDVTQFCSSAPDDRRILVVQLYEMPPDPTPEFLTSIVDHLRTRSLLPAEVQVTRHATFRNHTVEATPSVSQALAALGRDDITVLPSRGDLCLTILRNRARWRRISKAHPRSAITPPAAVVDPPSLVEPSTRSTVSR